VAPSRRFTAKGEVMRKQILVLLSALGLAVSTATASAQQPAGGKTNHNIKWSKTDGLSNTRKTNIKHTEAQASGKRIPPGPNVMRVPPGPNSINWKAGKADQLRNIGSATSGAGAGKVHNLRNASSTANKADWSWGSGKASPGKKQTLNPQPLPPGVHTLNPQPLPPGVHPTTGPRVTLNPQPLPPGVHLLNPQPLPPGVHTSTQRQMTQKPQPLQAGTKPSVKNAGKPK
jgi:hypothetical protein